MRARSAPGRGEADEAGERSAQQDREWIRKTLQGDHATFESLVVKYQDRAYWVARGLLFDDETARDVTQEAFLRVYRNLDRYDPSRRFYTWFYRIVVHLAIDVIRRKKKAVRARRDQTLALDQEYEDRAGVHLEREELRHRVRSTLAQVPPKYRLLLILRDLDGFTSKEIADIAGWNHATVRWRLHRARKLFRAAWEGEE